MTVMLKFGPGKMRMKEPGNRISRHHIPGAARLVFMGLAAIPFLFHPASSNAPRQPVREFSVNRGMPLLAEAPSSGLTNQTMDNFLSTKAAAPRTERILDADVEATRPDSSLRSLGATYPVSESRSGKDGGRYSCTLVDGTDTFSVATDLRNGAMRVTLRFRKQDDREAVPAPGTRTFDAGDFVRLVRRLPGNPEWAHLPVKDWSATRIFLDKLDGTDIRCAMFVPLDSAGRPVTSLGNGKYLVYTVVLHDDCIADGGMKVLHDRNDSLPPAGEKK